MNSATSRWGQSSVPVEPHKSEGHMLWPECWLSHIYTEALAKRMVFDSPFCRVVVAQLLLPSTLNHLKEASEQISLIKSLMLLTFWHRNYFFNFSTPSI